MATNEERLKILTMLQDGVINADEAAQLLEALGEDKPRRPGTNFTPPPPPGRPGRWLRVRVA